MQEAALQEAALQEVALQDAAAHSLPDRRAVVSDRQAKRLVNKADFERLLASRSAKRSAHFALHHVSGVPQPSPPRASTAAATKLSTGPAEQAVQVVDDVLEPTEVAAVAAMAASQLWTGWVVPKRHARRSVTRSLLKRQMRSAFDRHSAMLPPGLWLVRLRAPFAPALFISASSTKLAAAARDELDSLLISARPRPVGTAR